MKLTELERRHAWLQGALTAARAAMANSWSPYSEFPVGCGLVATAPDGAQLVFGGTNVENASFGGTICAERSALCAAVSAGYRDFVGAVVVTKSPAPIAPCGLCRQCLAEFSPEMIIVAVGPDDDSKVWTLDELLPSRFSDADL